MKDELHTIELVLQKFLNYEPILDGAIGSIAIENMFSYAPREIEVVDNLKDKIENLINLVVADLKKKANGRQVVFYCWFDEIARTLRFSFIPKSSRLPFGRDIVNVNDINIIIDTSILHWRYMYDIDDKFPDGDDRLYVFSKTINYR